MKNFNLFNINNLLGKDKYIPYGKQDITKDDVNAVFGNDNDLYIFSHLGNSYVEGRSSNLNLRVNEGRQISLRAALGAFGEPDDEVLANFIPNSKVELFFDGNPKFETTGIGVSVLGDLIVPDVGIQTSRVGLGTTNPIGMHSVDDGNGIDCVFNVFVCNYVAFFISIS